MTAEVVGRGACTQRDLCLFPEVFCHYDLDPCPYRGEGPPDAETRLPDGPGLPWSGLALGSADLQKIAAVGRLRVVALMGTDNAGKTTMLAGTFLGLRRSGCLGSLRFAGSYTLLGWQVTASHLQWPPHGSGGFPPHTRLTDARTPALLHLRFRSDDGTVADVLYPDFPGEWLREWAYDRNSGAGATWIAENADAFLVLADSAAFAGPERGRARSEYGLLARRVAEVARGRPAIPVWTKADIEVSEPLRRSVESVNVECFGRRAVAVSIHEGRAQRIGSPVEATTKAVVDRPWLPDVDAGYTGQDLLLAYRGAGSRGS